MGVDSGGAGYVEEGFGLAVFVEGVVPVFNNVSRAEVDVEFFEACAAREHPGDV